MEYRRIHKVGVELEGGWDIAPPNDIHGDGSVGAEGAFGAGEISSPPYKKYENLVKFIRNNYPQVVDKTCGFHIHISTKKKLDYMRLMDPDFYKYFREKIQACVIGDIENFNYADRRRFTDRFDGNNEYCHDEFEPDYQAWMSCKDSIRYKALNYCFSLHGTLECRLLPMFESPESAIKALTCYLEIVESWLAAHSTREPQWKKVVTIEEAALHALNYDPMPELVVPANLKTLGLEAVITATDEFEERMVRT